jgi:hypothetical protein
LIHYTFITDIVHKVINKFALLFDSTLYYYFDQIKEEEMGVEFGMCRANSDSYRVLVGTSEGKRPLGNIDIGLGIILEYTLQT